MSPKDVGWWRDIPMDGDLIAADYALTRLGEDRKNNALASAEILRMIYNGYLDVKKAGHGKVEITFANDKDGKAPIDPIASDLWSMMLEASGDDRILQDKEFSSWSGKHKKRLYDWTLTMARMGKEKFRSRGWMQARSNIRLALMLVAERTNWRPRASMMSLSAFSNFPSLRYL